MEPPTTADLLEVVRLIDAAPHAAVEIDSLMTVHHRGELSIEVVKYFARQLAVLH